MNKLIVTTFEIKCLHHAETCDGLLLLTPALDPALQNGFRFSQITQSASTIVVVNQVDRLRPIRESEPPCFNWRSNLLDPKEISIREAISYRATLLQCEDSAIGTTPGIAIESGLGT
jgi:predicted GTPase